MLYIGVDDSGRGPVIGPMVLAGVLVDEETEIEFKQLGVRDSKQLSANRREFLTRKIKKQVKNYFVKIIHPSEIDGRAEVGLNLNKIEAIKMAQIINELNIPGQKIKVYVDCPSTNIEKWQAYLLSHIEFPQNLEVHCEHKADINHVSCSAASIIAKTTRDAEIEKIKKKVGKDFGSGYPNDPATIKFLQEYFHKHRKDGIFRETWGTISNLKAKKEQKKLIDY